MPSATPSFKIFLDTPTNASKRPSSRRSSLSSKKALPSTPSPLPNNDKENIDPLTCLAANPPTKKAKKGGRVGLRPRPVRASSAPTSLGLLIDSKKTGAVKNTPRKPLSTSSRQATLVEVPLEEELSPEETPADRRARELTVLPLADLSEAFGASQLTPENMRGTKRSPEDDDVSSEGESPARNAKRQRLKSPQPPNAPAKITIPLPDVGSPTIIES